MCNRPGDQLHHLDGNRANGEEDNFALLCFKCHDEATASRGLRVRLDETTIRLFRDDHYRRVAFHRKLRRSHRRPSSVESQHFETMLEAVQVAAIRSHAARCDPGDWKQVRAFLSDLLPYASEPGTRVRSQTLEEASRLASRVRMGMPFELVQLLARITGTASIQGMPWSPRHR